MSYNNDIKLELTDLAIETTVNIYYEVDIDDGKIVDYDIEGLDVNEINNELIDYEKIVYAKYHEIYIQCMFELENKPEYVLDQLNKIYKKDINNV